MEKKVLVIGLDSAPAEIVFDRREELPVLRELIENGLYGSLRSSDPPITIPAWMVMCTGKDPGKLGLYGFRHRKDYSYKDIWIATSQSIKERAVWDIIGEQGGQSCLVSVPPSYPPSPVNGWLISCFITPDTIKNYTYPQELKQEIAALVDNYILDVTFRTDMKHKLLREIYEMTEKRFKVVKHLLTTKTWDFFMFVEIGPDRIHHAFWKFFDEEHPLHTPGNPFENAVKNYYRYLDKELGDLLSLLDENTVVFVVSDHGAKKMDGGICINEWLQQEGYLTLRKQPTEQTGMRLEMIDWQHTKAWGEGGYYCRLFMNVEGREPNGIIPQASYEQVRDEIRQKLEGITDEEGRCINTRVFKPEEAYRDCKNIPPDLIVYLGDLDWRSAASVGVGSVYIYENDTGPDDANHAEDGIFIWSAPEKLGVESQELYSIYDIAPTVLRYFGIDVPTEMIGRPLIER